MKWINPILKYTHIGEIRNLAARVQENELTALAAQSTYYLVLSFFPFLIFVITLISYTPLVQDEVLSQLRPFLPEQAYQLVRQNIRTIMLGRRATFMSTGMLVTLFLASNGVAAILRGINKAYHRPDRRPFWKVRGMAILMTAAITFIIVISLLLLVFGQLIGTYVFDLLGLPELFRQIWEGTRVLVSLALMIFVFTLFYKISPQQKVTIRQSLPGAVFSTLGWLVLSYGFAFYVNRFGNYAVTYGSIGAIIVLLTWLYLSSIVILLGGEINAWRIHTNETKKITHFAGFE